MMKKNSFLMLAIATLLASCSQEDTLQTEAGNTLQTVTITTATGGSMMTRAANTQGDEEVSRCLLQIFEKTGTETQALQPMEGYETSQSMTGSETGGFSATATLNPTKEYAILFWADAATYDATAGLQNVRVADNAVPGIAYAGKTEWGGNNTTASIDVNLKHAVAKVTLHSTTTVPADRTVTLTGLEEYGAFNIAENAVADKKAYPHEMVSIGADGDIMTFYALVNKETQTLTLNASGADVQIPNVPLAPNKHVILTGDVANAGMTTVTFTATVDSEWGSKETQYIIPNDAVGITTENCSNISGDGNYVVNGTFNNQITITGGSPTIYLNGANVSVSSGNAINITSGSSPFR